MAHQTRDRCDRALAAPGTRTRPSTAGVGSGSRNTRDTPVWCALASRAGRACTGFLATWRIWSLLSRDEQLANFADGAIAAAALGDVVSYGFDRLGRVGDGTGESDALERSQIVEVVADEGDFVHFELMTGAQLVDGGAFVG